MALNSATTVSSDRATGGTVALIIVAGVGFVEGTGKAAKNRFSTGNKST